MIDLQKAYGRSFNAESVMSLWEWKLKKKRGFTVEQILYAIDVYSDKRDDFPSPANLIAILEPEEPEVSRAEYVNACQWLERNGWPMISDAGDTKKKFEDQEKQKRTDHKSQCADIQKIVDDSSRSLSMSPKQIEAVSE